jgi:hypothetical protein
LEGSDEPVPRKMRRAALQSPPHGIGPSAPSAALTSPGGAMLRQACSMSCCAALLSPASGVDASLMLFEHDCVVMAATAGAATGRISGPPRPANVAGAPGAHVGGPRPVAATASSACWSAVRSARKRGRHAASAGLSAQKATCARSASVLRCCAASSAAPLAAGTARADELLWPALPFSAVMASEWAEWPSFAGRELTQEDLPSTWDGPAACSAYPAKAGQREVASMTT